MKVIRETIGDTAVLIQIVGDIPEIIGEVQEGPAIAETGIIDKAQSAYAVTKLVITDIARDVGAQLSQIVGALRPKQVEIEFSIGIAAKGEAGVEPMLVVGGEGESAFKVKMMWELK
jgi:hypothetical protein